jgi:hypothetical protein
VKYEKPQVKLSASKEELELRNEIIKEKILITLFENVKV